MKHKIFLLLLLLFSLSLAEAQNCRNIDYYNKYTKKGKELVAKGEYIEALKFYNSAKSQCEDKAEVIDKLIAEMTKQIEQERTLAENAIKLVQEETRKAEEQTQKIVKVIQALNPELKNYYEYLYNQGQEFFDAGEYEQALDKFRVANTAFDKPDTVDLGGFISKVEQCQESQNKAYALIQERKYEEAEAQITIAYGINPKGRKTALLAFALNPAKYALVKVKGGTFMMGSKEYKNEKPIHEVYLDDFSIGRYEVTNLAYAIFLNRYGSKYVKEGAYSGEKMINTHKWGVSKNSNGIWEVSSKGYDFHPVVYVTWYGSNEFCQYYGGRLPTEAEWEYSASGRQNTKDFEYSGAKYLNEVAWYSANSDNKTHAVGLKQANELGLYDMSGNVWEWCSDWYAEKYYRTSPRENPRGAENGVSRVLRGGGWNFYAVHCRVAFRYYNFPEYLFYINGFRFVF